MKPTSTLFIGFLLLQNAGFGQQADSATLAKIDTLVQACMTKNAITGLSIGIVKNGAVFLTKGYGWCEDSRENPVDESTCFNVASVSKLFTATAVMQLVEAGKLSLDGRVVDYLPGFKMKDKRYQQITIEHLLTHSAGLAWDLALPNSPDDSTALQLLVDHLTNQKLKYPPGEKITKRVTYSNTGYDLLGYIVQTVSQKEYTRYVTENILAPTGMNQSRFYFETVEPSKLARPYYLKGHSKAIRKLNHNGQDNAEKPLLNGTPHALEAVKDFGEAAEHNPSGNLISNSKDLSVWMVHILNVYNKRNPDQAKPIGKSTLERMWVANRSYPRSVPGEGMSIGLGWWTLNHPQYGRFVFHVGNNPGFCSILMISPERNLGVTILCNANYALRDVWNRLPYEIIAALPE